MPIMRSAAAGLSQIRMRNDHSKHSMGHSRISEDVPSSAAHRRKMSNNNVSKSSSSSIASYGNEVKCKIAFKLSGKEDGSNVFYKDDENRFKQKHTLKLRTPTEYIVLMEIEPAQELLYVKFGGKEHKTFETLNDPETEKKTVCKFVWSTKDIEPTIRCHRTVVPCVIKFKPYKEVEFKLQTKFYSSKELYHFKGYPLSSVDMTCKAGRGTYHSLLESLKYV